MKNKSKIIGLLFLSFLLLQNQGMCQCYYAQPTSFWAKGKSTGITDLDNIINNENVLLKAVFGVNIDLYVGGDAVNQENAMFAPICGYQNCEGEIWLGLNLMSSLFKKTHGLERLKAVFAHEYAHALQSHWGFVGYGKYPELHADFLAGYYTGIKGTVSSNLLESFVKEFYSMGDYNFFSASHHGTGTERGCAFIEGYKIATEYHYNTYQAYLAGIDYVRLNNPCISFKIQKQYETAPVVNTNTEKGTIEITTDKKTLRLVNNQRQIIGYTSPSSSYKVENIPVGLYYITPKFEGFMGTYALPQLPIQVNPNTKVIAHISKVRNFFSLSYKVSYSYYELPKPNNFFKEGYDFFQSKNFDLAIEKLNKEISVNPTNYNAYFFRALGKSEIGDLQGAINDYKTILSHNDEILKPMFLLGTIYNNIGYSYLKLNDLVNAEKYIQIACETNPFEYYIWGSSGELNYLKGNYEKAVNDFTKSIELMENKMSKASSSESNGFAYYFRGISYIKLKKIKLACDDLSKAKELGYYKAVEEIQKNCNKK